MKIRKMYKNNKIKSHLNQTSRNVKMKYKFLHLKNTLRKSNTNFCFIKNLMFTENF